LNFHLLLLSNAISDAIYPKEIAFDLSFGAQNVLSKPQIAIDMLCYLRYQVLACAFSEGSVDNKLIG
jgi:hypothetical protein